MLSRALSRCLIIAQLSFCLMQISIANKSLPFIAFSSVRSLSGMNSGIGIFDKPNKKAILIKSSL